MIRKRRLIIFSVPFIRISRILLNSKVLNTLQKDADLLIVSPFANDSKFQSEFRENSVEFHYLDQNFNLNRPLRALYSISESFRMNGYWRKYKDNGMAYYWSNLCEEVNEYEEFSLKVLSKKLVFYLVAIFGRWELAWRLIDYILGPTLRKYTKLNNVIQNYDSVTLVQSSTWGLQDRMLASVARKYKFRTILLPYTTDQLWINGYLLCDYDAVCVQGSFEEQCAIEYHQVVPSKIVRLGSIWFRGIDELREKHLNKYEYKQEKIIMYAGISSKYFPRNCEYEAIDAITREIDSGSLGNVKLIYRPFALDQKDRENIEKHFQNKTSVFLQWPEEACAGLDNYSGGIISEQLVEYIKNLNEVDLLIMSLTTTLGLDAAYLDSAVIANFCDSTDFLERRHTELRFSESGELDCAPGMVIVKSLDNLTKQIHRLFESQEESSKVANEIISVWDYPQADFAKLLNEVLFEN